MEKPCLQHLDPVRPLVQQVGDIFGAAAHNAPRSVRRVYYSREMPKLRWGDRFAAGISCL
jgi:hypothetical protein